MIYWHLFLNELIKAFSKWRTYIGFGAIGGGVILAMWGMRIGGSDIQRDLMQNLGDEFITTGNLVNGMWASYLLLNTIYIHIPFLVTLLAGDAVAGEGAAGTFRIYLIRPVSRNQVLVSKLAAAFTYTAALMLLLAILSLGLGNWWLGVGDIFVVDQQGILILPWDLALKRLALGYLFAFFAMCTVATLTFLFSVMVTNAIGPIVGSMAIIIVSYLLTIFNVEKFEWFQNHLFTSHFGLWQYAFRDPIPWDQVGVSILNLSVYSVIFVVLAFVLFKRKDVLT